MFTALHAVFGKPGERSPAAATAASALGERFVNILQTKFGLKLYVPMTLQTAWTAHPHHVSFSGSLWVDLAMVGVIYRLDELYLTILACGDAIGFAAWIPYSIYLTVFDAFETLILIQAEYETKGSSVSALHAFLQLASWLFLALMGASIPNQFTCTDGYQIASFYFPVFKLCHSFIRLLVYLDIYFIGKQRAALPRVVSVAIGMLPLIASVVFATQEMFTEAYSMFPVSYVLRYLVFHIWVHCSSPATGSGDVARTNMPFIIARYRDWIQLQLGSVMLGLVAGTNLEDNEVYAHVSSSYAFLAVLDLLSFASDPRRFNRHALVNFNSRQSHAWFLLFILLGWGVLGIAVGTRYWLRQGGPWQAPSWVLVGSTMVTLACILLQKMVHEDHLELRRELRTKRRMLVGFVIAIGTCVIAISLLSSPAQGALIPFNLFVSTALTLILHAINGGLQREISKKVHRTKLRGQILAVLVARAWLQRARLAIAKREMEAQQKQLRQVATSSPRPNPPTPSETFSPRRPAYLSAPSKLFGLHSPQAKEKTASPRDEAEEAVEEEENDDDEVCMEEDEEEEDGEDERATKQAQQLLPVAKNPAASTRVLKKLILNRFYLKATFLVPHDMFADYHVSWSDLFLDIIYVAVVYRIGYFLIDGLGLSHAPATAHIAAAAAEAGGGPVNYFTAVLDYAFVYVAVFNLWFVKLNYASKVKSSDVFHMVVDMILGYFVLLIAVGIESPLTLEQNIQSQYWVSGMLMGFHGTLLLLWMEALSSPARNVASSHNCAVRNIKRQLLSLFALLIAFFTTGTGCPLLVTCFFWFCTYLFPLLQRVEDLTQQPWSNEAPFLLRYVLHRLGDVSLLVLGEGVLQVIRAVYVSSSSPDIYYTFTLAFLNLTCCRYVMFQLDCVDSAANKHAVLQEQKAYHLLISVLRLCLSGPAIVAFGVSMKLLVGEDHVGDMVYGLAAVSAALSMLSFTFIYHLHRTAYLRGAVDWKRIVVGTCVCALFLIFPWIPDLDRNAFVGGLLAVWIVGILFHGLTDDFLRPGTRHQRRQGLRRDTASHNVSGLGYTTNATAASIPVIASQQQHHNSAPMQLETAREQQTRYALQRERSLHSWSNEVSNFHLKTDEDGEGERAPFVPSRSDLQVV